jgi:hypothetical protein
MRTTLGIGLVLLICAGCATAQSIPAGGASAPPSPPAPAPANGATGAPAGTLSVDSPVDDVLDALDKRGDEMKDFTAVVTLADTDTAIGNETKLTGHIWMQRLPGDDARVRVNFDRREVNEKVTSERQEFMLAGGMFTERNYVDRKEVRRQVLKPGQKMNLLKLGEGPFPLPLGQDKADVHRMFDVSKLPPAEGDPGGTIHVQLKPKPSSQFERRFATIDFWVDPNSRMPVRIVTEDPNGTTVRTTELKDVQVDAGLGDKEFTMPPVDEGQWRLQQVPFEE